MTHITTPTTYIQDGTEFSRITSVLKTIPRPALDYWFKEKSAQGAILAVRQGLSDTDALRFAMESPELASKDARDQGEAAHEYIRVHNLGAKVDLETIPDPVTRKKVSVWIDFKSANKWTTNYAEKTLFSQKYRVAGTLDHFGEFNGVLGLDDYKTGGVYDSAFIQLSAYNEMLKENGITTEDVPLRVFQITDEEVVVHTPESFFKKGGRNAKQDCHIPTHNELFLVFRAALFMHRFQILKTGKYEHLVKEFSDLAKDTSTLLAALESQLNAA